MINENIKTLDQNAFNILFKNIKRNNTFEDFEVKRLIYYPYWDVKETLIEFIKINDYQSLIFYFTQKEIKDYSLKNCLPFIFYIFDELNFISNLEKEYLSSTPDNELVNAGVRELDRFGSLNVIDQLANGDILKWEEVKKLAYKDVFDKLWKSNIEQKIQKNYNKIVQEKYKKNGRS